MSLKSNKVPVNLDNYPSLKKFAEKDTRGFIEVMKSVFALVEHAYKNRHFEISKKYFYKPYHEVITEILSGFFDTEGILAKHGHTEQGKTLFKILGHAEHPLHAALTGDRLIDMDGESISYEEKYLTSQKDFNIKDWVQGMLFLSYYGDATGIGKALSLNNYILLSEAKTPYLERLMKLSPVYAYQHDKGILVGKMHHGTGFFDVEVPANKLEGYCPVCGGRKLHQNELKKLVYCPVCLSGFTD